MRTIANMDNTTNVTVTEIHKYKINYKKEYEEMRDLCLLMGIALVVQLFAIVALLIS